MNKFSIRFGFNEASILRFFESILQKNISTHSAIEIIDKEEFFKREKFLIPSDPFFESLSEIISLDENLKKVLGGLFGDDSDATKIKFIDFFVVLTVSNEFLSNDQKIRTLKNLVLGVFGIVETLENYHDLSIIANNSFNGSGPREINERLFESNSTSCND
jgi:hypothetical protein